MSWLSVNLNESLKSIGGQITNLTRDVLSDDIDDEGTSIFLFLRSESNFEVFITHKILSMCNHNLYISVASNQLIEYL